MSRLSPFRFGLILVVTSVLTAACVTGGSSAPSANTSAPDPSATISGPLEVVSYQAEGTPLFKRYQALASKFESAHPGVKVKLTFGGGAGMPPIAARYRAGEPPDVNPTIAGPDGEYAKSGAVMDLSAAVDQPLSGYAGSWKDAMYPGVLSYLKNTETGKFYAVPESVTAIQFFYNKRLFDQYGLQVPKTVEELFAVSDALKSHAVAPFAVTGTFNYYMQMYMDYLLLRHSDAQGVINAIGGKTVPAADRTTFAKLTGVNEAAKDLEHMVKGGYFMNGFRSTDFTAAQLAFFQGKAGMILMGSWLSSEMSDSIPSGFELGTFPFPTVSGGSADQSISLGSVQLYEVAAKAKNPNAAIAWLKFLASKDNQESYVKDANAISAYKGISPPVGFADQANMLSSGQIVKSYFNLLTQPAAIQNAYQLPIAKLFFGKTDAASMVSEISAGLTKLNNN